MSFLIVIFTYLTLSYASLDPDLDPRFRAHTNRKDLQSTARQALQSEPGVIPENSSMDEE